MADVGKTTAGSPWDEPLPAKVETKRPVPTVVGDLDVAKKQLDSTSSPQAVAANADIAPKPTELNIPIDSEEKVGAKVDIGSVAPAAPVAPIEAISEKTPAATFVAQNPAREPAATDGIRSAGSTGHSTLRDDPSGSDSKSSPQANKGQPNSGAHSTSSGKPSGGPADFWQSVYGQAGSPDGTGSPQPMVAAQTPPTPVPVKPTIPNVQTEPAIPAPTPKTVEPNPSNLYQPAPTNPTLPPQIPIRPVSQQPTQNAKPQPAPQASGLTQPAANPPVGGPANRTVTFIIAGVLGLIILFFGGVFLTEKGLISIGLEKVYGAIHLEALWGGLPANAENAFAMSAVKMKSQKSIKISGSASITVNKGVKSNIISPIVSAVALPIISLKDEQLGPKVQAVLTAASTDSSSNLFQGGGATTDQSTTGDSQSSTPSTSSASSTSTVEELTTGINAQITDSVSGADININSSKNANSEIQLVYSNNKMYLKSPTNIIYDSKAKDSWVSFDFNKFGTGNPDSAFWGSKFSGSDFSIVGSRGNSETINSVRCFHYTGSTTIGNALESFGLGSSSVSSLDFDYWLGVKDHLIHKLTMKIIPGSEAAVSRIDINLDFSDFGSDSVDYILPATSIPYTGLTSAVTSTTSDLSTAKGRDTQRKADLASIAKALESYHSAQSNYPRATGTERILSSSGTLFSALVPTYLSSIPLDPNDPTNYYGYKSSGTTYTLSSVLEDKTDTSGKQVGSNFLYFLSSL